LLIAVVAAAGLFLFDSSHLSEALAPDQSNQYRSLLTNGISLFRLLLIADVLIVLFLIYSNSRGIAKQAPFTIDLNLKSTDPTVFGLAAMAAIIGLSTLLRTYKLDTGLWIDEYLTLINYVKPDLGFIATNFKDDNQHWLFSVLAKISTNIFGETNWAFRLPALVFGILSILAVYNLGRLLFRERVALLAAFLLAVSYHHIWYSQNARGYTILLLGTILSVHYLLKALHFGKNRDWVLYSLSLALCVGGHLTGVFIGLAHFLIVTVFLMFNKTELRFFLKPLFAYIGAALITLHCFAIMVPQMAEFFLTPEPGAQESSSQESGGVASAVNWKSPFWVVSEMMTVSGIPIAVGWPTLLLLLALLLVPAWICWKRHPMLLALTVLPALILMICMFLLGRNLWPRLLFNYAGLIALYMAFLVFYCRDRISVSNHQWLRRLNPLPVILLCAVFLSSTLNVYSSPKQDFSSALDYLLSNKNENDTIVALHMAGVIYGQYYQQDWAVANSLEELQRIEESSDTLWVVYTLPQYIKQAKPALHKELQNNYQKMSVFPATLGNGEILVLKNR